MLRHSAFSLTRLGAACAAALALAAAQPVLAQSQPPAAAPQAQADSASRAPELTLQASASSEVKQDTVRITLSAEVEANDQPGAGKKLSAALEDVVKRARGAKNIDVRTGGYNVWPNTNSKGKVINWRGQGEVVLESKDFQAASALAAKLGDKTAITNISFQLSRAGREAEERKLLSQAATAFRERALAAANAFGFSGYRLIKLDLGGSGGAPVPRAVGAQMMMAKDAGGGAPNPEAPLEAGEVTVSIAVNGTVALQ
ncbi:DUF541 domain-containing protein [Bordetella parapertussis]|uniref:Exported protein n=5 Tax=Bordetella TaxID=517 RepID=Q7W495_BORPA|nr:MULTISPECIES: SIMPL domain-containing protein [Bordetella]SHS66130.1 Predicted periplasmic/secreted protein [Mycobacteroides abscessus subsp. abscessus]AOB40696.1 hypothetical protein BBB43_19055 [Bordetella parapertussis]AUL44733.1 hypothetical protein BTL54_19175 [Bordetella parapertussis]AWP64633.1 hypothetical protein B7P06_19185 [Bordetella parapertussis]AWP72140.1 hypothetical protein B7O99_19175 [Bordetella parapertussis]